MTFDPKRPCRQKNGREAVFIGKSQNETYPLVFDIEMHSGWIVDTYTSDGLNDIGNPSDYDLISIPDEAEDEWEYAQYGCRPDLEGWEMNPDSGEANKFWRRRKVAAAPETKETVSAVNLHGYLVRQGNGEWITAHPDFKPDGHLLIDMSKVSIPASAIVKAEPEKVTRAELLDRLYETAKGLCEGTDWNNGTHAKNQGYRQKLIDTVQRLADGEGLT